MDSLDALRGTTRYPPRIEKFILPKNLQTKTSLKPCPIYAGVSCSSSFLHPLFATTKYHILNSITCFADLCRAPGIDKGFCGPDRRERMDLDYFLMHQLNNKFINQPVLIDRLIVANISNHNPQDFFPGDWYGTKECYVLTPRSYYLYGLIFRPDRRAGNGYWKGTTPGNVIFGMDGLVGVKKNLCFYEGDQSQSHGLQTNWKMIEYRLQQHICSFTCDHKSGRLDNWVLCKIYEDLGPEALFSQMERMNI